MTTDDARLSRSQMKRIAAQKGEPVPEFDVQTDDARWLDKMQNRCLDYVRWVEGSSPRNYFVEFNPDAVLRLIRLARRADRYRVALERIANENVGCQGDWRATDSCDDMQAVAREALKDEVGG